MRNGADADPVAASMTLKPKTPNGLITNGALLSGPSWNMRAVVRYTVMPAVAMPAMRQRGERKWPVGKRSGTKIATRATMLTQIQELIQPRISGAGSDP